MELSRMLSGDKAAGSASAAPSPQQLQHQNQTQGQPHRLRQAQGQHHQTYGHAGSVNMRGDALAAAPVSVSEAATVPTRGSAQTPHDPERYRPSSPGCPAEPHPKRARLGADSSTPLHDIEMHRNELGPDHEELRPEGKHYRQGDHCRRAEAPDESHDCGDDYSGRPSRKQGDEEHGRQRDHFVRADLQTQLDHPKRREQPPTRLQPEQPEGMRVADETQISLEQCPGEEQEQFLRQSHSQRPPERERTRRTSDQKSSDCVIANAADVAAENASNLDGPTPVLNSSAAAPAVGASAASTTAAGTDATSSAAAAAVASASASPYTDLQRAVHCALQTKEGPCLTTSDKVALALEVLRARQLELDLAQARNNIEALVKKTGSAPRTLRSVIPASTVKGLPVGTPVEITAGKFLLSPTTNDPQALFLTLELQHFGESQPGSAARGSGPHAGVGNRAIGDSVAAPADAVGSSSHGNLEQASLLETVGAECPMGQSSSAELARSGPTPMTGTAGESCEKSQAAGVGDEVADRER